MFLFTYCEKLHFQSLSFQFLVAERATRIIKDHAENHFEDPLFMYLPFQNVHSPLQVPKNYSDLYPNLQNTHRKIYSGKFFLHLLDLENKSYYVFKGMVTALDEAIGRVISSLKKNGLYKNTIIVFSSDVSMYSDSPE